MSTPPVSKPTVQFDHHSDDYANRTAEILGALRSTCPVAWTDSHDGYWVVTGYDGVSEVMKNWEAYSSENEEGAGPRQGALHPSNVRKQSMQEDDPPKFFGIRKPLNKYFSQTAVRKLEPEILDYATWAIDQVIERGECDLANDVFNPVTAFLTNRLLGLPLHNALKHAHAMHAVLKSSPGSAEREEAMELFNWSMQQFADAAAARRTDPGDDLISTIATMELEGGQLTLDEVIGCSFLFMSGGVDTTAAALSNAFIYLDGNPSAREWLIADYGRLELACQEFIRYYSPVQGLARTVNTEHCVLADQQLATHDRVWASFASANTDPAVFEDPDTVKLDRFPNPHVGFGAGIHRCIGKHFASAMFCITAEQVLTRMPDLAVDLDRSVRYPARGVINGWDSVHARFTPGSRVGTAFTPGP